MTGPTYTAVPDPTGGPREFTCRSLVGCPAREWARTPATLCHWRQTSGEQLARKLAFGKNDDFKAVSEGSELSGSSVGKDPTWERR